MVRLYEIEKDFNFPEKLNDEYEIADYIENISVSDIDYDLIVDNFRHCEAILKKVDIDSIEPGHKDNNIEIKSRTKKYLQMNPETIPPLIVDNGRIMDGNHRYRVAKKLGLKYILIYDIQEK